MKELERNNILNKQNLEEIFALYNIQPSFIEKDFYITKILNVLSKINNEVFNLVFTGGTSLHKCYNLIKRFSEDIDFKATTTELITRNEKRNFRNIIINEINNIKDLKVLENTIEFWKYFIKYK